MEIEKQRWAPLSLPCAQVPGAFDWSQPLGSGGDSWEDVMEEQDHRFLFDVEYKNGSVAGAFMPKSCTEYAAYSDAWKMYASGSFDKSVTDNAFTVETGSPSKAGRVLDLDIYYDANQLKLAVIFVPNFGAAARQWWWSGTTGYTGDELSLALQGKAVKAFKQDNVLKKIVAIDRGADGKFRFVLNKLQAGEAWWLATQ